MIRRMRFPFKASDSCGCSGDGAHSAVVVAVVHVFEVVVMDSAVVVVDEQF